MIFNKITQIQVLYMVVSFFFFGLVYVIIGILDMGFFGLVYASKGIWNKCNNLRLRRNKIHLEVNVCFPVVCFYLLMFSLKCYNQISLIIISLLWIDIRGLPVAVDVFLLLIIGVPFGINIISI